MISVSGFFTRYILTLAISCLLYFLYEGVVQPANALEMVPLQIDTMLVLFWGVWNTVTAMLIPNKLEKPSDCFPLIYSVLVLMTGAVTWSITDVLSVKNAAAMLFFLAISVVLYKIFVWCGTYFIKRYLLIPYVMNLSSYVVPAILLLLMGVVAGIISGQPGSFSINDSYARRIIGRENFPDRALISYVFLIALNGASPFAAFLATNSKRYWLLLFPMAFSVYAFWLVGVKEPVLLVIVLASLGYFLNFQIGSYLPMISLICLGGVFLGAFTEYANTGYSYIADYFIRRSFIVTGQVQSYYADYILHQMNLNEWWEGAVAAKAGGPSMLIGSLYFGNMHTNANTNMLMYTFLQHGFVGLIVALVFVSFVFSLLDCLYKIRSSHVAMGIGFLYALLLAEQNYTTAFISSGVGALCALIILFRSNKKKKYNKEIIILA